MSPNASRRATIDRRTMKGGGRRRGDVPRDGTAARACDRQKALERAVREDVRLVGVELEIRDALACLRIPFGGTQCIAHRETPQPLADAFGAHFECAMRRKIPNEHLIWAELRHEAAQYRRAIFTVKRAGFRSTWPHTSGVNRLVTRAIGDLNYGTNVLMAISFPSTIDS